MELFDYSSSIEEALINKASFSNTAIGGSMELLPLCNMQCKMCYIYHSREEMEKEGKMLDYRQWIQIAQDMRENGILFLLLTGGEPLIYPNFKLLYKELLAMGFIISLNTNGTLIDEDMADFFAKNRCRNINITIYGENDETYNRLCGNPRGYTQLINTLQLLKERKIPFQLSFTPTPYNYMQFEAIQKIANKWGIKLIYTSYLFPPVRRKNKEIFRLSPEEVAKVLFLGLKYEHPEFDNATLASKALESIQGLSPSSMKGLSCRGGHSGFWANWKGELTLCSMIPEPKISLLNYSFAECWSYIVKKGEEYKPCQKCMNCNKKNACHTCFASCYAETGQTDQVPEYLCQTVDAYIELLQKFQLP